MKTRKILVFVIVVSMVFSNVFSTSVLADNNDVTDGDSKIKNIIFMIPDGGGMSAVAMTDHVKKAGGFNTGVYPNATQITQNSMYIMDYLVGAETTHSASSDVTDSAAAGTALSTGKKTNNGYIGIGSNKVPVANLIEASQWAGKRTGIVGTCEWTHATPATFTAHDISRANMTTMSEQIVNQDIDVVFGNTHSDFENSSWFTDAELESRGYDIIRSREALSGVERGDRMWSKFPSSLYYDFSREATVPTLAEMTDAAITALADADEDGFFLMVEGSQIDLGGHGNNAHYMVGEFMAFDEACKVAIEFAKERDDTIVLVAPDHDTGGMYWSDINLDAIVARIQAGKKPDTEILSWTGKGHTAWNGGIFIYAPDDVSYPEGIEPAKAAIVADEFESSGYMTASTNLIDNTDIARYLAKFIGVNLEELSDKLFVDVTDMGSYSSRTEIFTFDTVDASVKRNTSTALIEGEEFDMDGQISLYINSRFYVPAVLLSDGLNFNMSSIGLVDVTDKGTYDSGNTTFTFNGVDMSVKNGSTVYMYNGKEISMGETSAVYFDGRFYVPEKLVEAAERFSTGQFGEISIIADYNAKTVEILGWIDEPNVRISMMATKPGVELSKEIQRSDIAMVKQLNSDYNGDYMLKFSTKYLAGKYTLYMNYEDSDAEALYSKQYEFKNTIPEVLIRTDDGDEIMYMNQLEVGDNVNVTLRGFDFADDFDGLVVIAQYDEQGVLVDAHCHNATGGSVDVGSEIYTSTQVKENVNKIRVMYWNNSNMSPVSGAYTIYSR